MQKLTFVKTKTFSSSSIDTDSLLLLLDSSAKTKETAKNKAKRTFSPRIIESNLKSRQKQLLKIMKCAFWNDQMMEITYTSTIQRNAIELHTWKMG